MINKIIKDIDELLRMCCNNNKSFSDVKEEVIEEAVNKREVADLTRKVINDIVELRHAIHSDNLEYNEETWYALLRRVIVMNTEFHNSQNSKLDKELQDRLFQNITELNKEIIEWNNNHDNKIMTLQQGKERYINSLTEDYFNY